MNKKMFVILFGITLLLLIGCEEQTSETDTTEPDTEPGDTAPTSSELTACTTDSDCIAVDTSCCNCNNGGTKTVINKQYELYWTEQNIANCEAVSCLAVISDDPSCSGIPKCINNVCTFAYPAEELEMNTDTDTSNEDDSETAQSDEEETQSVAEFTVEAVRWGFSPDTITVQKGDLVKITIENLDFTHGMKIPDLDLADDEYLEFTADEAGTFTWYCNNYCGDGHSGMQGTFIVEE